MKIIITKRFDKYYLKDLEKYFPKKSLLHLLKNKYHTFISLHFPYFKFKGKTKTIQVRGVLAIFKENKVIPLILYLKKDKKH
jgi:hypothetical protein